MQLNFSPKKPRKVETLTAHFYLNLIELKICISSSHCRSLVLSFLILISSSFWPSEAWVSRWADRVVIASLSHCRKKSKSCGKKKCWSVAESIRSTWQLSTVPPTQGRGWGGKANRNWFLFCCSVLCTTCQTYEEDRRGEWRIAPRCKSCFVVSMRPLDCLFLQAFICYTSLVTSTTFCCVPCCFIFLPNEIVGRNSLSGEI